MEDTPCLPRQTAGEIRSRRLREGSSREIIRSPVRPDCVFPLELWLVRAECRNAAGRGGKDSRCCEHCCNARRTACGFAAIRDPRTTEAIPASGGNQSKGFRRRSAAAAEPECFY